MTDTEKLAAVVVQAVQQATAPLLARLAELEARPVGESAFAREQIMELRRRLETVETRAAAPGPVGPPGPAGERGQDGAQGLPGVPGRDGRDGVKGEPGQDGVDGQKGADGRDGVVTLEGLTVELVGRDLRFLRETGEPLGSVILPVPIYRGVFKRGETYAQGDTVTFAGSLWIARDATDQVPGEGATAWQLSVKAGRDGKEGKPGAPGPQGLKGDRGEPGRNYT